MGMAGTSAIRYVSAAAVVAVTAGVMTVAGPASTADAGGKCRPGACSQTWNDSGHGFYAVKNWCIPDKTNGDQTTKKPTCGKQRSTHLRPDERTPGNKDWDAFKVPHGYCFDVDFELTPGFDFHRNYDRRKKKTVWVKVANNGFAKVRSVSKSHC